MDIFVVYYTLGEENQTMFLQRYPITSCCLCGSTNKLTGEHKIKASALRQEFGRDALIIGVTGPEEGKMKSAQSTNSKHLKFNISICEACNSSRTQQADREFDHFHKLAMKKIKSNEAPLSIFEMERYSFDSEPYLNVFRYFAKILCCHIAEVNGPIPTTLAEFAIAGCRIALTRPPILNAIDHLIASDLTMLNPAIQTQGNRVSIGGVSINAKKGFPINAAWARIGEAKRARRQAKRGRQIAPTVPAPPHAKPS